MAESIKYKNRDPKLPYNQTQKKILAVSLELYNTQGIENITVRHIGKEMGVLHSNITYYWPKKDDIIKVLYLQLQKGIDELLNKYENITPKAFFEIFSQNFELANKYRFCFINNSEIFKRVPAFKDYHAKKKAERTEKLIGMANHLIELEILKSLHKKTLTLLITNVFLVSDFWIVFNEINPGRNIQEQKDDYLWLIYNAFEAHLTEKGKTAFITHISQL